MSVRASTDSAAEAPRDAVADTQLEVVVPAVSGADRAKGFYDARYTIAEQARRELPS